MPTSAMPAHALTRPARLVLLAALAAASVALTACGGPADPVAATATTTGAATTAGALEIEDAWVKTADTGMTAAFGVLHNTSGTDITVTTASSPAATMIELHEVAMVGGAPTMRPKQGGFVVPAGGTHVLAPGGDHLMLMGVTGPVVAGDSIPVTLTYVGGTYTFDAVAKDFAGGNETYAPATGGGMDMGAATP